MDGARQEPRLGMATAPPERHASSLEPEDTRMSAGTSQAPPAPYTTDTRGVPGSPVAEEPWGGQPRSDPDASDEVALGNFLAQIWRRRGLIVATVGLVTLAATIVVLQITPRYSADTRILVGAPEANVVNIEDVLTGLGTDQSAVRSEVEILSSRTLAAKVVDALDLTASAEFNPRLRPPSLLSAFNPIDWIADRIPESWRRTGPGAGPAETAPEPGELEQQAKIVAQDTLLKAVSVSIVGRSRVISVTATSEDPALAAAIANSLSELYLLEQLEAKFEATKRATDWLSERIRNLRQQVEASERAVETYRRQHGLIRSRDTTVTEQQISEINTQLILARTGTAEAEARLRQVRTLLASEGGVDSATEVLASPLIQRLRERETDVARQKAEMATEYGPRHPKMINIRAELDDIRARIEAEVGKIVRGLGNELEVARARERTLARNLETLKAENATSNTAQAGLRVLEREAAANRALFDTFLARWKETGQQDGIQHADARIISRAEIPSDPTSPRTTLVIGLAAGGSAFLALLLVLVVEQLDRGFRSTDQIERLTGFGTLSLVPLLTRRQRRRREPHAYVLGQPASAFAESLRTLHTGWLLSGADAAPKSMLVASSVPDEGKTTVSVALARLVARSGRRVLLIDGDLRRHRAARLLGLSSDVGLVQATADPSALENGLIQEDTHTGLHVLASGGTVPNPLDLIGSARMRELMAVLRDRYDLVVIDSPPVLVVSDARLLARLADKTVFVVRWANTRRETAVLALKQLIESGASVAGVLLTMVDVRNHARYTYSDSGYYDYGSARKYRQYHTD